MTKSQIENQLAIYESMHNDYTKNIQACQNVVEIHGYNSLLGKCMLECIQSMAYQSGQVKSYIERFNEMLEEGDYEH